MTEFSMQARSRFRPRTVGPSCKRGSIDMESTATERLKEMNKLGQLLSKMRSEFTTFELMEKGRQDDVLLECMRDIRKLEKTLNGWAKENNDEISWLKRNYVNLSNEKNKLKNGVKSLESRMSKLEKDVCVQSIKF